MLEELLLPLEVGLDCLPNLNLPQRRLVYVTGGFAGLQHFAVGEAERVGPGVDVRDDESLVLVETSRQVVKVVVLAELLDNSLDRPALELLLNLDAGRRRLWTARSELTPDRGRH